MKIYFSGIGGVGIGPLAEIARDVGYKVYGSDREASLMTEKLSARGVELQIGEQDGEFLEQIFERGGLDWFVYTAALPETHPELVKARHLKLKTAKRDELLAHIIKEKNLKLIAVAGTHGKTTTTGMIVWLAKYFGIPVSYSIGTTLSWGPSGQYAPGSEYFVYECDEFDRNFLNFSPFVSIITSLEYDHPDTYKTEADYFAAFKQFAEQSDKVVIWREFAKHFSGENIEFVDDINPTLRLHGEHNRRNASLILKALESFDLPANYAADGLNKFPGTNRRFERIAHSIYSDYGHTPSEIAATLQMAHEISEKVVLVYQPHQNIRQHEIKDQYTDEIFKDADEVYWLPTYLSREDENLLILTPEELTKNLISTRLTITEMDDKLLATLLGKAKAGQMVLAMGAGSIDGWIRQIV